MPSTATRDVAPLSEQFDREGFCLVPGLFSPDEVEEIRDLFARIHAEGRPGWYEPGKPRDGVDNPNDPLYRYPRVMMPHRFEPRARDYLLHPAVFECLEAFFHEEPVAAQSMFYFKPPGARGQALHQDQFYLLAEPGTSIAAWTAIDDCDEENGAMLIVPGTKDLDLVCPDEADRKTSYTSHFVPVPKGHKPQLVRMKAGDTLFFNGSLIHGSGPNRSSDRFRRSFICHYVAGRVEKLSRFYQPLLRRDGSEYSVENQDAGGPCGEGWSGLTH